MSTKTPLLPEGSAKVTAFGSVYLSTLVTQRLLLRLTWFFLHKKQYIRGSIIIYQMIRIGIPM